MKIAIIGYGKMGQEIERLAVKRNHEVILIIDSREEWQQEGHRLAGADVAIEFSMRQFVIENILHCFDAGVPVIVGTTGWHDRLEEIKKLCSERNQALFHSPNFSIGVNLFFDLNRHLASLMSDYPEYGISIEETHHIHKQDAPSGTAITLANDIMQNVKRKEKWVRETSEKEDELGIRSFRTENVPGTHIVKYESDIDEIQIVHSAKSRKGFASGAILAAEFLKDKKGFYEMKDLLSSQNLTFTG